MTETDAGPRKTPAPRRREQEILEAAAEVFHERGYESTSIQHIAKRVGILKGSLYYYITSKEDLLFEIIQGVHEEALRNLERTRAVEGTPLQRLRAFAVIHFTFNAENRVKTAVFFQDFRSLSEGRRQKIVDERDIYDNFVRDLIREGQDEGLICPEIDAKLAAISILGMLNWMYHWYRPGGSQSASEIGEAYADFVVAGLACTPDTHVPGHRRALAALPPGFDPSGNGLGTKPAP
jgi:TetR/AcrR family transcriptional regulator, cholesterol catabolism regulator